MKKDANKQLFAHLRQTKHCSGGWERAAGGFKGLSAEQDRAVQDRVPKEASLDYS